jgi:hypothetical protein
MNIVRQTRAVRPKSGRPTYDLGSTTCARSIKHLWRRSMKKRFVSIALLTCGLLCANSVIQAQAPVRALTSQAPVLPMNVQVSVRATIFRTVV